MLDSAYNIGKIVEARFKRKSHELLVHTVNYCFGQMSYLVGRRYFIDFRILHGFRLGIMTEDEKIPRQIIQAVVVSGCGLGETDDEIAF